MKNYNCQTCGEEILLEPRDAAKYGAYCTEHLFSQKFTALDQLADQAAEEEQRGHPAKSHRAADESTTERGVETMSHDIADRFVPGVDEYILPSFTDIDGTYYPGERIKLRSVMENLTDRPGQTVGNAEVESVFYLYDIYDDTGQKSDSVRMVAVDEMNHSAEMTLRPAQVQLLTGWMVDVDVYVRGDSIFAHSGGDDR